MISPTDLFHPPPVPHFKTFHVFPIYCPNCPQDLTLKILRDDYIPFMCS